jgi:hypothetical protein
MSLNKIEESVAMKIRKLPVSGLNEAIPRSVFEDPSVRYTLGMLLFFGERFLLVQPKGAPEGWFIPPQEGLERGDQNLVRALERGLGEELGPDAGHIQPKILGAYINTLPKDRQSGNVGEKRIICVAAKLRSPRIKLNAENAAFTWVNSWRELDEAMALAAETRFRKYRATCVMLQRACNAGLLNWSVPEASRQQEPMVA